MTLSFNLLGHTIWTLQFDTEQPPPTPAPIVAKGIKGISKLWLAGMVR